MLRFTNFYLILNRYYSLIMGSCCRDFTATTVLSPYGEHYIVNACFYSYVVWDGLLGCQSATLSARKTEFARQLLPSTRTPLLSNSRLYRMSALQRHPANGYRRYSICTFPRFFDYGTRSILYRNRCANWRSFEKRTSVESSSFTGVSRKLLPTGVNNCFKKFHFKAYCSTCGCRVLPRCTSWNR
uniref:Uncharacterized protein n=1 Tax=Parascaris univalens TaxID=6257 RepID=A0A915A2U6_PARUN